MLTTNLLLICLSFGSIIYDEVTGYVYSNLDGTQIIECRCINDPNGLRVIVTNIDNPRNPADLNNDGRVDMADFAIFAANWGHGMEPQLPTWWAGETSTVYHCVEDCPYAPEYTIVIFDTTGRRPCSACCY